MLDKKSGIEIGYEIAKMKQITNTFPSTKHPIRFVGHGSPVGLEVNQLILLRWESVSQSLISLFGLFGKK
jgi:hypothetical protein